MAENLSASDAICAVFIIDTVVWNQIRYLFLDLDKVNTKSLTSLRRLQEQEHAQLIPDDHADIDDTAFDVTYSKSEISKLLSILKDKLQVRKNNPSYTLPTARCVRHNQHLLAVYCESKIADELLVSLNC